ATMRVVTCHQPWGDGGGQETPRQTDESINMAAELYIANHQHDKALQVLVQFCGIVLERGEPKPDLAEEQEKMEAEEKMEEEENPEEENPEEEQKKMESEGDPEKEQEMKTATTEETGEVREVVVPDHVPVDIRVKLMVCLIHQHVYRPLDSMLTSLMEQSPEELGSNGIISYLRYNGIILPRYNDIILPRYNDIIVPRYNGIIATSL
uniref:uncharacterized protein LOC124030891 n=1 Tax=Oncorhynchus gorbuscha TaxID=8017 RepID=UPI001EAEE4DF